MMITTSGKSLIKMVILNISWWKSDHTFPRCYYGKLILCTNPDVTFHNIRQFDVNKLGEKIEVTRQLTREEAVKLDKRYWNANYTQCWDEGEMSTNRFDDYIQATEAGMAMFRELKIEMAIYWGLKIQNPHCRAGLPFCRGIIRRTAVRHHAKNGTSGRYGRPSVLAWDNSPDNGDD